MRSLSPELVRMKEQPLYGLWKPSSDRTVSQDIKTLSTQYYAAVSQKDGEVLPFFVLSRNYREDTGAFELMIGGTLENSSLQCFTLPAGEYGKLTIRPKLGFLWGPAIGEAKRYFYTQWLPVSRYQPLNLEYECHTERSIGRHPSIELFFAVKAKG